MTLLSELNELITIHCEKCELYRKYLDGIFPEYSGAGDLGALPWIPVRAFKNFHLLSITQDEIYKTMRSSGTGGLQSTIYLDQETARLQQRKLIEIFQDNFGSKRLPMLVIDAESTVKNRHNFSARTAAINGFSIFSRGRAFALDDELNLDVDVIREFLHAHSGEPIFLFGFTFIMWERFLLALERAKLKIDLSNALIVHGGGWKKLENIKVSNSVFKQRFLDFTGCQRVHNYYGMIEQTGSIYMECEAGEMHAPAGADVIVRRPKDFSVADHGEEGLVQLFSNIQKSYPGHSILSEDLGRTYAAESCNCGRSGTILRISGRLEQAEVRGCSDAVDR